MLRLHLMVASIAALTMILLSNVFAARPAIAEDQPPCTPLPGASAAHCFALDLDVNAPGLQSSVQVSEDEIDDGVDQFYVDVYARLEGVARLAAFDVALTWNSTLNGGTYYWPRLDTPLAERDVDNDAVPDWSCDMDNVGGVTAPNGDTLVVFNCRIDNPSAFAGAPGGQVKLFRTGAYIWEENGAVSSPVNIVFARMFDTDGNLLTQCPPSGIGGGCLNGTLTRPAPPPDDDPPLPSTPACPPQLGALTGHCVLVDADVNTVGEQNTLHISRSTSSFDVDVVARVDPGTRVLAFNFSLRFDTSWLDASVPTLADDLAPADWWCLPAPSADWDGDPATGDVLLSCFYTPSDSSAAPTGTVRLGRVHFAVTQPPPTAAYSELTLDFTALGDQALNQIFGCQPSHSDLGGGCYNGAVSIADATPGDTDGDGVANSVDNCAGVWNPGQANNDANAIDIPGKMYDDITAPNSDISGDVCDNDDDNDGLVDGSEGLLFCAPVGPLESYTDRFNPDTDGDRFLDGAECALGFRPDDPASKPAESSCGTTSDTDGDGLLDYREYCYYGSDTANTHSGGDSCSDGKKVASINADRDVNVIDLQQVADSVGPSSAPGYIENFDMTKNGSIDVIDLQFVAAQKGPC